MALPKVYVFCNGCKSRDWHNGYAMAEDGTPLAGHVSSSHEFVRHDLGDQKLGYPKGWTREEYAKHYPDGYEVVWIEGDELKRLAAEWNAKEPAAQAGDGR
jgi:hypothetical protein